MSKSKGNRNYTSGRSFEYRVRNHYRKQGFHVVRSPQSKGPADLIALKKGEVLLMQCKHQRTPSFNSKEKRHLLDLAEKIGGRPLLVYINAGRHLVIRELAKNG